MALSAGTKKSLAKKAEAARKKGKKVTAGQLGRVYNKGLAAYRTGHRPGTTPSQWAMARVNSYLYALKNGKFRGGKHDTDLLPEGHPMSSKKAEKKAEEAR